MGDTRLNAVAVAEGANALIGKARLSVREAVACVDALIKSNAAALAGMAEWEATVADLEVRLSTARGMVRELEPGLAAFQAAKEKTSRDVSSRRETLRVLCEIAGHPLEAGDPDGPMPAGTLDSRSAQEPLPLPETAPDPPARKAPPRKKQGKPGGRIPRTTPLVIPDTKPLSKYVLGTGQGIRRTNVIIRVLQDLHKETGDEWLDIDDIVATAGFGGCKKTGDAMSRSYGCVPHPARRGYWKVGVDPRASLTGPDRGTLCKSGDARDNWRDTQDRLDKAEVIESALIPFGSAAVHTSLITRLVARKLKEGPDAPASAESFTGAGLRFSRNCARALDVGVGYWRFTPWANKGMAGDPGTERWHTAMNVEDK